MPENRRPIRNPVARSPLLRKGGAHGRGRSAERRDQRNAVAAEVEGWLERQDTPDRREEADYHHRAGRERNR